ncbi:MAG: tripartite tricarboxylate transporter TctB family protein [Rothia sp. (in: high G+C Gram-positive bacteria)]|nr:tripartite tricarboxylate transporter TctB family protein [Rothia sp. (in: high G+C Gram-positive bacteria)]
MSQNIDIALTQVEPQAPSRASWAVKKLSMPLLLLAFAAYLAISMINMDVPDSVDFPGPRFFPAIITFGLLVMSIVELLGALNDLRTPPQAHRTTNRASFSDADPADRTHEDNVNKLDIFALFWCLGGFLLFISTLKILGWVLAAALMFWCVARGFGAKKPLHALVVGLTVSSIAYLIFSQGLGLPLPAGFLEGVL